MTEYRRLPLIYLAGPITLPKGQSRSNAIRACREAEHLLHSVNIVPLIPHLSVFWAEVMDGPRMYCTCGRKASEHEKMYFGDCGGYDPDTSLGMYGYEEWLGMAFNWMSRCDAVFRMPGLSKGADREVALANELGIPVFTSMNSLRTKYGRPSDALLLSNDSETQNQSLPAEGSRQ